MKHHLVLAALMGVSLAGPLDKRQRFGSNGLNVDTLKEQVCDYFGGVGEKCTTGVQSCMKTVLGIDQPNFDNAAETLPLSRFLEMSPCIRSAAENKAPSSNTAQPAQAQSGTGKNGANIEKAKQVLCQPFGGLGQACEQGVKKCIQDTSNLPKVSFNQAVDEFTQDQFRSLLQCTSKEPAQDESQGPTPQELNERICFADRSGSCSDRVKNCINQSAPNQRRIPEDKVGEIRACANSGAPRKAPPPLIHNPKPAA
ncbi:hypothetical protein CDD81_150 [Ophiocordyceps australis]|uniref:Hydrophobin n=1 Tax=Ophiocordyceps australis TaxID=1399860 RepID=A0A2C5YKD0_9HYPO|nr:hypothetical protein CDD81_150 [Ophiocordyceps australis]